MIAVVPVRAGRPPKGAETAVDAAGGRALLVGEGVAAASELLATDVVELSWCEAGAFAPAAWTRVLSGLLAAEHGIVLPGAADGRDLLGRLAVAMRRQAVAWCEQLTATLAVTSRHDGRQQLRVPLRGPFVATVVPRAPRGRHAALPTAVEVAYRAPDGVLDASVLGVDGVPPDEVELADAERVVAGGLGCLGDRGLADLAAVARGLGASLGVTRPIADRGLAPHERQIGTTGVAIDPALYLAVGISGAVQHTAAIGTPRHVVAVNTDAACPMMQLADLAVVADGPGTLRALAALLGEP